MPKLQSKNKIQILFGTFNYSLITFILDKLREVIAHKIYDIYNANENFIIDESEFTSLNGKQIWVCGIINFSTKNYRVGVIQNRNADTLDDFIRRFIFTGNIIVSNGWPGYNWLNENNSGYRHKVHVHGQDDFGFGLESTSIIESI